MPSAPPREPTCTVELLLRVPSRFTDAEIKERVARALEMPEWASVIVVRLTG
jgi:hypothetical protein